MTKDEELQTLKDELSDWKAARRALSLRKSYQIGNRTLTMLNYSEVRQAIIDLEIEISNLERDTKSYMRTAVGIPSRR